MNQWRIRDLMTTDPVTVRDNAPVSEVADVLTGRQITAVPVVDRLTFAVDDTLPAPRPVAAQPGSAARSVERLSSGTRSIGRTGGNALIGHIHDNHHGSLPRDVPFRKRAKPPPVTRPGSNSAVNSDVHRSIDDLVDEWGRQSFPASDPPANW